MIELGSIVILHRNHVEVRVYKALIQYAEKWLTFLERIECV
jgi:hypothetical protein